MKERITGFDFARALAIFGMVIVNFKIAMGANSGSAVLLYVTGLLEGRASALFVVLAGVGLTFLTSKARLSGDSKLIQKSRWLIVKRGILLVLLGLAYTPIWEADILHFYGFYFMVGAAVFTCRDKRLLQFGVLMMLLFPVLALFFNYEKGWNWETLAYIDFWTVNGMIRHIFFNGFHPVVPWSAFLILGMWLGRQDLRDKAIRSKLLQIFAVIWIATEGIFGFLKFLLSNLLDIGLTPEDITFLFSTSIIPPLPQYILAAGSLACVVILLSLSLTERFSKTTWVGWVYKTGQMSLTLYVAHVIIGMGVLEAMGMLENQSIGISVFSSLVFCLVAVLFSVLWLSRFRSGPLEWGFRKLVS